MVRGLKNAYLLHFSVLPSWFNCRVCYYLQYSFSLSQGGEGVSVSKKKKFQLIYDHCALRGPSGHWTLVYGCVAIEKVMREGPEAFKAFFGPFAELEVIEDTKFYFQL